MQITNDWETDYPRTREIQGLLHEALQSSCLFFGADDVDTLHEGYACFTLNHEITLFIMVLPLRPALALTASLPSPPELSDQMLWRMALQYNVNAVARGAPVLALDEEGQLQLLGEFIVTTEAGYARAYTEFFLENLHLAQSAIQELYLPGTGDALAAEHAPAVPQVHSNVAIGQCMPLDSSAWDRALERIARNLPGEFMHQGAQFNEQGLAQMRLSGTQVLSVQRAVGLASVVLSVPLTAFDTQADDGYKTRAWGAALQYNWNAAADGAAVLGIDPDSGELLLTFALPPLGAPEAVWDMEMQHFLNAFAACENSASVESQAQVTPEVFIYMQRGAL